MTTGDKLRQRRKEVGLSLKEVADKIGVSEATVSRWESGDIANMKRNYIIQYANALNVSPMFLLDIDEYTSRIQSSLEEKAKATSNDSLLNEEFPYAMVGQSEDEEELSEILTALRDRSEMKMLFKSAKGATKEQLESIVKLLESFKATE